MGEDYKCQPSKKRRKVIDVQQDGDIESCLLKRSSESVKYRDNSCFSPPFLLRRAVSIGVELTDDSWLSSTVIDLVIARYAKVYTGTRFLSPDFALYNSSNDSNSKECTATDIVGTKIDSSPGNTKPILCIFNSNNIHWNVVRVVFEPCCSLELYEPMGKPSSRRGGVSHRDIPRNLINWLDRRWPLTGSALCSSGTKGRDVRKSWISLGTSMITSQQQFTNYDCGVACLLYAEKLAQGKVRLD